MKEVQSEKQELEDQGGQHQQHQTILEEDNLISGVELNTDRSLLNSPGDALPQSVVSMNRNVFFLFYLPCQLPYSFVIEKKIDISLRFLLKFFIFLCNFLFCCLFCKYIFICLSTLGGKNCRYR